MKLRTESADDTFKGMLYWKSGLIHAYKVICSYLHHYL